MPGPVRLEVPRSPLLANRPPAPRVLSWAICFFYKGLHFCSWPIFVPTVQIQIPKEKPHLVGFLEEWEELTIIASFGSKELRDKAGCPWASFTHSPWELTER